MYETKRFIQYVNAFNTSITYVSLNPGEFLTHAKCFCHLHSRTQDFRNTEVQKLSLIQVCILRRLESKNNNQKMHNN